MKRLDTLFIAAPTFDPVQATGRILRPRKDKLQPIVVHFVDDQIPKYAMAWEHSKRHYKDLGVEF